MKMRQRRIMMMRTLQQLMGFQPEMIQVISLLGGAQMQN